MSSDIEVLPMPGPRYARFSRRLRAMLIDWITTLIVMFGAVLLAVSVGNDILSRQTCRRARDPGGDPR